MVRLHFYCTPTTVLIPRASVPHPFPPLGAGAGALCGPFESSGGFISPHHLLSFYSGRDLGFETSSKPQIAPQIINTSLVTPKTQIRPVSQFNSLRRSFDREKTSRTILLRRLSRRSSPLVCEAATRGAAALAAASVLSCIAPMPSMHCVARPPHSCIANDTAAALHVTGSGDRGFSHGRGCAVEM